MKLAQTQLKSRLDKIDAETIAKGKDKVIALRELELHGMWRKGREVLRAYPELENVGKRGEGVSPVSYRAVGERIGRDHKTIAAWARLFLAHQDEKECLAWAKAQGQLALAKWEAAMLPPPKPNGGVVTPMPPDGKFSVILADPPWRYDFSPTDSRKIENQYPTMEVADICKLGERIPFADDAVLYLWATAPKLREALEVVSAWGFNYTTHGVWDKEVIGMGYWFRGQHEPLLVATRGSFPPPPESARVSSVIHGRRSAHSEKPEAVYEIIEAAYVGLSEKQRLEMFCREARPGWTPWGNEVSGA